VVIQRGDRSEIRVTELSSPGTLLTALFGHNIMQYRLAFQDGRILRAELTGTAWGPTGRRLCTFHAI